MSRFIGPAAPGATTAWTNMPAAITELLGATTRRVRANLDGMTTFALCVEVTVAGAAGADMGVQYSLDNGTTWKGMDNGTAGAFPTVFDTIDAVDNLIHADATIAVEARVDNVLLRVVGREGNATADPAFRNMHIQFKA